MPRDLVSLTRPPHHPTHLVPGLRIEARAGRRPSNLHQLHGLLQSLHRQHHLHCQLSLLPPPSWSCHDLPPLHSQAHRVVIPTLPLPESLTSSPIILASSSPTAPPPLGDNHPSTTVTTPAVPPRRRLSGLSGVTESGVPWGEPALDPQAGAAPIVLPKAQYPGMGGARRQGT